VFMAEKIDYLLQDTELLKTTVANNRAAMDLKGYTDARYNNLTGAETELRQKEVTQQNAVKLVNQRTATQNNSMAKVAATTKLFQNAAKSAFGNDTVNLKKFRVGEVVPNTVKKLATWAEYFTGLTLEHKDILLQNGVTEEDLTELNSAYGLLISSDAAQENAKKLQLAATQERDEAYKKLLDQIFKTRNFAKACFAKRPEILVQFKPLAKGRSSTPLGTETVTAETKTKVTNPA